MSSMDTAQDMADTVTDAAADHKDSIKGVVDELERGRGVRRRPTWRGAMEMSR